MATVLTFPDPRGSYLQATRYIDFDSDEVRGLVEALRAQAGREPEAFARAAFEHVRDRIAHSADVRGRRVTRTASDVARHGEGICHAKSHLLVALLRAAGIPAGVCYQRLTLNDGPEDGHVIHALVACELRGRWIRLDARFSIDEEHLAFTIRPEMGEIDYRICFADAHPLTAAALEAHDDALVMCATGLPDAL